MCMSDSSITSTSCKQFYKQARFLSIKPLHTCAHTYWPQVQDQWPLNETTLPYNSPKQSALNLKSKYFTAVFVLFQSDKHTYMGVVRKSPQQLS